MINYLELFNDYNVDYALEGKNVGSEFIGVHCPFCGDTSYHGGVPRDGSHAFSCWRCGSHNIYDALNYILGVPNSFNILASYTDDTPQLHTENKKKHTTVNTVHVPGETIKWYHRKYLEQRRYDPDELIQKYHITGTAPGSTYGKRIYFPIIYKNEIVSYQGRSIDKNPYLKYLTAEPEKEKVFHKHILFNYDNATSDFIVLTEGLFDALRLGDGACATFGTNFMREQLLLLRPYNRIFLLYDNEFFAQQKAVKAIQNITNICTGSVYQISTDTTGDPDDLSNDDAKYLMNELRRTYY